MVPARPDSVADKPVAAPGKPAIVAVGKADETPAKSDEEKAAADAASGAKIFDLSKFRGKK